MAKSKHIAPTRHPKEIKENPLSVIILGANIGYRMKSYGPQSMFKVGNKTLIEHQSEVIRKKFPSAEIVLVIGYQADKVIKNKPDGIRIIENQLYESTNEVEQLRLALNNVLTSTVIIISADLYFDFNTLLPLTFNQSCLLVDNKKMISNDNIGVTIVNNEATILHYSMPTKWSHITLLTGKELTMVKTLCGDKNRNKLHFSEILNMVLEKGSIPVIEPTPCKIQKFDSSEYIQ